MKHTPTPWKLITEGEDDEDAMIMRTVIGFPETKVRNLNEVCLVTTGSFDDDVENANADLIVKAVNNHEQLITALTEACDQIRHMIEDREDFSTPSAEITLDRLEKILDKVKS